jgi:hypothetical protein
MEPEDLVVPGLSETDQRSARVKLESPSHALLASERAASCLIIPIPLDS